MGNLPQDLPPASKPIFKSKTAAVSALIAISAFIPQARDLFAANPQAAMIAIGVIGLALRAITKGKVSLFGAE